MAKVGDRLKEERTLKGWSQRDLAEESGTNVDTVSGIERGQHEPRPSTLRKLATALGVEVRDLFEEPVPLGETPRETGQPDLTEAWRKFYENLFTLPAQPLIEQSDEEIALHRENAERAARGEKPVAGFLENESPERARLVAEALRIIEEERRQARARR